MRPSGWSTEPRLRAAALWRVAATAAALLAAAVAPAAPADAPRLTARERVEVSRALDRFRAEIAAIRSGIFREDWHGDPWLKARAQARNPEERALFERVFLDQWQLGYDPKLKGAAARAFHAAADSEIKVNMRSHASWLKALLARIGWFDISRYGEKASMAAWLLVQHSDHDPQWQRQVLEQLGPRVRSGDMQPRYHAYLVDRVEKNAGRPQVYGTQGRCVAPGRWEPFETNDPAKVDERRKSVGLDPMDKYRAMFDCP
jgi:hypothetical protein